MAFMAGLPKRRAGDPEHDRDDRQAQLAHEVVL
jgi:hypothetical protein